VGDERAQEGKKVLSGVGDGPCQILARSDRRHTAREALIRSQIVAADPWNLGRYANR